MLVLTRKRDEKIRVYKDGKKICEIVVTKAVGRISLGFEGDPTVRFIRTEIDDTNK